MFRDAVIVKELHLGSGSHKYGLHFHLFVITHEPIEVLWKTNGKHVPGSQNQYLAQMWKDIRESLQGYGSGVLKRGFGRSELLPVRSSAEAISRYVSKYLVKGTAMRYVPGEVDLKGARLINYTRDCPRKVLGPFSWANDTAALYRRFVGHSLLLAGVDSIDRAKHVIGPKWGWAVLRSFRRLAEMAELQGVSIDEYLPWLSADPRQLHALRQSSYSPPAGRLSVVRSCPASRAKYRVARRHLSMLFQPKYTPVTL